MTIPSHRIMFSWCCNSGVLSAFNRSQKSHRSNAEATRIPSLDCMFVCTCPNSETPVRLGVCCGRIWKMSQLTCFNRDSSSTAQDSLQPWHASISVEKMVLPKSNLLQSQYRLQKGLQSFPDHFTSSSLTYCFVQLESASGFACSEGNTLMGLVFSRLLSRQS